MIRRAEISWRQGDEEGQVPVEVVYSGRRTMALEVKQDGTVKARVPYGTKNEAVTLFIKEHRQWIVEKWFLTKKRIEEATARPEPDYIRDPGLEAVYRKKAGEKLRERVAFFAEKMKVDYGRISVKAAKTRWGSCSAEGNLNFHWKLILMPPEVLDYVVVHELAHRKEMNHSPRFWKEVEMILPDYRKRRLWLKENGGKV
jgi:hypothetical protein